VANRLIPFRRRSLVVTLVAALALLLSASANASLLPGLLPGVLSPSNTPTTCDTSASQPFAQWGDTASYALAPGGSFEGQLPGWSLGWGTKVVSGNEPFYVHGAADSHSLYIPAGGTVLTAPMCFAPGDWKLRFFAKSSGQYGSLRVTVQVKSLLGLLTLLDGGTVSASGTWKPSPELPIGLLTQVGGLLATDAVSFRLTASSGSSWLVDDVYLDPWVFSN
jgi:hypothetical protein